MSHHEQVRLDDLPGAELVLRGLSDARKGIVSIESLLVEIAAPRLRSLGLEAPASPRHEVDGEIRLYELLGRSGTPDPYSRYNALLRELVSFERALEHRVARARRHGVDS